jgi:hypothetical protein
MKYAIFLYDPDGDTGEGIIIGPFKYARTADDKAEEIREAAGLNDSGLPAVQCIVSQIYGASITPDLAVETMREH